MRDEVTPGEGVEEIGLPHLASQMNLLLEMLLELQIDQRHLERTMTSAVIAGLPATVLAPYILLLSPTVMEPFVGKTLHEELQRKLLAFASGDTAPATAIEEGIKR